MEYRRRFRWGGFAAAVLLAASCPITTVEAGASTTSGQEEVVPAFEFGSSFGAASPDDYIVQFRSDAALRNVTADLEDQGLSTEQVASHGIYVATVDASASQAAALRDSPAVLTVERDQTYTTTAEQLNPPWGLDRVDQRGPPLNNSYSYAETGVGVDAYVIDSGLWLTHSEFVGRVPYGAYVDFGDGTGVWDCNGHGTHVAGILGGTTYGLAKSVSIIPVKVLDCDGRTFVSILIDAIDWIIEDHLVGTPAVANISIGGNASSMLDAAIDALIADGVTVVVAAGNDASPTCNYSPARVAGAITVAASEIDDAPAAYTNDGPCTDIFAPGSDIQSAYAGSDNASATLSGTSMASPHVAGAAALILEASPSATAAQVWAAIDAAATIGAVGACGDPDKLLYIGDPTVSSFASVGPCRLLDSRPGSSTVDGQSAEIGLLAAGSITELQVTGRAGVPGDASAVVLNVTVVQAATAGYVTVFPCNGGGVPNSSNLNFWVGATIPNAVVVKVGLSGTVCLYTSATTHLLVDIDGYYPAASSFVSFNPSRLLDSRPGSSTVDGQSAGIGLLSTGSITQLQVTGRAGVPGDAAAVVLNVTVVAAVASGYATVFPCDGGDVPNSSNLNFWVGATIPNAVIVKVGVGGSVCLYTSAPTHLLADISGYYPAASSFVSLSPSRLLDSRPGASTLDGQFAGIGLLAAGSITALQVTGRVVVPDDAYAVVLNVTVAESADAGYVTVFPCGDGGVPNSSNLNFWVGATIPNAVVVKLGVGGTVCLYTSAATHLLADVTGYYPISG